MQPFSPLDVARAVAGELRSDPMDELATLTGVSTDSRSARAGDLFIALRGPATDGHRYVPDAFGRGARAALVSDPAAAGDAGRSRALIVVPDTQIALGRLAAWHRDRCGARRVGVTGSSGKTTTKEMLAAALEPSGRTLKNEASQNGETGVPLTLLRLEDTHRFAVLEMGMRGAGQIAYLAEIARPDVGVVTNIGPAHLEFLGTLEGIARAKGELLQALAPDGLAVLPAGDRYLPLLREMAPCPVVTSGTDRSADVRTEEIALSESGSTFQLRLPEGRSLSLSLPVPGAHNVSNAAAAMAAAWAMGADLEAAARALAAFQPPAMRSAVFTTAAGVRVLNDAYNANPDSMRAGLGVLARQNPRRVALLGDMLELGPCERDEHRALGIVAAESADLLIAVGPRAAEIAGAARDAGLPDVHWFPDTASAGPALAELIRPGDTVLIKGSRGMRMETLAETVSREGSN